MIQTDNYYPFGLTFNSFQRENSIDQRWKFQGQEHVDDLGLNWDSFKWRNHQPDIGRFFNIDPLADKYVHNSPYAFSENKVTSHVELEGLESVSIKKVGNGFKGVAEKATDKQTYSEIGKGFEQLADKSGLSTLGKGIAKLWKALSPEGGGGFTLTSEKGGVTGGTDKNVRQGKSTRLLEVGFLLNPDIRNSTMNVVKNVEEETNLIDKASKGDVESEEAVVNNGAIIKEGLQTEGQSQIDDSTVVHNTWRSNGDGSFTRVKSDTVNLAR